MEIMSAHDQWATRPPDQRFWDLQELHGYLEALTAVSQERKYHWEQLSFTYEKDNVLLASPKGEAKMNHWSFGQVCSQLGAPADYLRTLPPNIAAALLVHGRNTVKEAAPRQILVAQEGRDLPVIRAFNGKAYARLPSASLLTAIMDKGKEWKTPPAYPSQQSGERTRTATQEDCIPGISWVRPGDIIAPAGLYASDRDMFVFLVDPNRVISPSGEVMARGMILSNSEVGSGSLVIQTFYFDAVCGNHIIWNAQMAGSYRHRHVGKGLWNAFTQSMETVDQFLGSSAIEDAKRVQKARDTKLLDEPTPLAVRRLLLPGIGQKASEAVIELAEKHADVHHAAPDSVWGVVSALTRYSQTRKNADERNDIDLAAGKLLDRVPF